MERKIRTIPKEKMKGIKAMSPFMIDELMLVGLRLLNESRRENNEKQKLYNDIIQECYEFFERMSSKYIDIIEKDSQCIDISIPTFNDVNYNISPIREVSIKFNVFCDDEKLKAK